MRLILLLSVGALAACSSVEERTDRNSGVGLTQGSMTSIEGAQAPQPTSASIGMDAPAAVPTYAVSASKSGGDLAKSAELAAKTDVSPAGVPVTLGGKDYALRQVNANGMEFAVAEPVSKKASGAGAELAQLAGLRTGCLATGQGWEFKGTFVTALNCR